MTYIDRVRRTVTNPRFLKWWVLPNILYALTAYLTDAAPLIGVLNAIDIALSVSVCIAFLSSVIDAIFKERPIDRADLLALGIFCGWAGNFMRSTWSMIWRLMGQPDWLANTDVTTYILFIIACGAIYHLVAPGAINERVPPRRWIKIGAWIGGGVFLAIILAELHSIETFIEKFAPAHDRSVLPDPKKTTFQEL